MFFFINKYLKTNSKVTKKHQSEMSSGCISADAPQACIRGCCLALVETSHHNKRLSNAKTVNTTTTTTTTKASRSDFVTTTVTLLMSNTFFTNHESLPTISDAFSNFISTYPQYTNTEQADHIRDYEYYHLSSHTCLDYTGHCLFSHAQLLPTASSIHAPVRVPSFAISYKSASLKSQVLYGDQESAMESSIRKRIMRFLNIAEDEYSMVCVANRTSAFKILAEYYPFHTNKRLLTVYDYESEAVNVMIESAQKKGAKIVSASFSWPNLRINTGKLKKLVIKKKKMKNGLMVFPLQSRMTGARYPYLWMSLAQQNGWHVVLDASALGPKDMDTLGLSLIQPEFIICSFFKVFGENPSGFAALFIKKTITSVLETSVVGRSIGIVRIIPTKAGSQISEEFSGNESEYSQVPSSLSGPESSHAHCDLKQKQVEVFEIGETSEIQGSKPREEEDDDEIVELESDDYVQESSVNKTCGNERTPYSEIELRGLDHADSIGLPLITGRLRYIVNWLVNALMKLRHPNSDRGQPLVQLYGPRIKFDRAPAVAFNVFDWKGEKVDPTLVQKLADRSSISLSCGFLQNIWFSDKYEEDKNVLLERRVCEVTIAGNKRRETIDLGITVVNASLGFLSNFEDAYRLWAFVAKFLDADFVEKERWRYMALNQKMIEV
ncbi:uncharacterized protein LOC120272526 [Dioscorea cayenensis subsp. rotundata]|uniref:Uncharacterized protein LOC120272526 n=1 Tax=Dioscorea cayennensis subsp. rotundata TaxID=55577 RepID=A0AB40C913_DIOCR|nr:uncharacterized protein LOC120272526 [Dioscorea cayenensis subsp. rotundata]